MSVALLASLQADLPSLSVTGSTTVRPEGLSEIVAQPPKIEAEAVNTSPSIIVWIEAAQVLPAIERCPD
jgi:hypothetical protein